MRHQRRVSGNHHDDRTQICRRCVRHDRGFRQPGTDVDAADSQMLARAEIRLDENTNHVAFVAIADHPRGAPGPSLEPKTLHARPTADAAFFDSPGRSRFDGFEHMIFGDMKPVDVIEKPVIGFR